MLSAMIFLAGAITWCALLCVAIWGFLEEGSGSPTAWVASAVWFVYTSWIIAGAAEYERTRPCVAYESRMTYNAATKTMVPMRVCVERGEWEK